MLQRIQTLYWALSATTMLAFGLLPYAAIVSPLGDFQLRFWGLVADSSGEVIFRSIPLVILAVLAFLFPILTIARYRSRGAQIHLSILSAVLQVGVTVLAFYYLHAALSGFEDRVFRAGLVISLPVLGAILSLLGLRAVKRDIAFLRRMDRLR